MQLDPGASLGPYEILAEIGSGGMGVVYRARDTRLGREVALKVLPEKMAADEARLQRFEREARAASSLNHPNIVSVYDVGREGETSYIVSELVLGKTLRALLQDGALSLRRTADVGAQIAEGLAAAHAADIAHRDIKPDNVMLTAESQVKILDFGLATQPEAPSEGDATVTSGPLTSPGMVMGTPGYMSPEQVRGEQADHRSDIFSFGLVLYEMLSGQRAFSRDTSIEEMNAILKEEPPELNAEIPLTIAQIVAHCIEKEPARRFQSAPDLAFALRALTARSTQTSHQAAIPGVVPPVDKPMRKLPVALALGALALGFLVAAILLPVEQTDLAAYRITPLATDPGPERSAAWAPDGQRLAYLKTVDNVTQIFIRGLDSPVPAQVTKVTPESKPRPGAPLQWTPDGNRILFLFEGEVWSISAAGGEPERVGTNEKTMTYSLSPDGTALARWIVTEAGDSDAQVPTSTSLWVESPVGSEPVKYEPAPFEEPGSYSPIYLGFSPDSEQLLISMYTGAGRRLWLVPYPSGEPRMVFGSLAPMVGPPNFSWMPDSRRVVLATSDLPDQPDRLWIGDTASDTLRQITGGDGREVEPAVTPEGERVVFTSGEVNLDVAELMLDGSGVRDRLATRRDEYMASWSPVREEFVYVTNRSGVVELWLKSVSDGRDRPVVTQGDFADGASLLASPDFSPDGTQIVFAASTKEKFAELWISPIGGGTPTRLTPDGNVGLGPAWSPDGSSVAYISLAEGDIGIAVARVGSSEPPKSLSQKGCSDPPRWSPDGKWLTCNRKEGLMLVSSEGEEPRIFEGLDLPVPTWSKDGKSIYGLQEESGQRRLVTLDPSTGETRVVATYGYDVIFGTTINPGQKLSLAADGRSAIVTRVTVEADIMLLEGFDQEASWLDRLRVF